MPRITRSVMDRIITFRAAWREMAPTATFAGMSLVEFEEEEWKAACAVVRRDKNAGEPTLCEFIAIIGKLGGHLGRKSDGSPGPQSIWQGLARVRDFALVWQIRDEE